MLPGRCDIQPAEAEVGVDSPAELLLVDEELAHDCARVSPLQRPHVPDDSGTLQDVWRGGGPVLPGQGALQLGTNIHDRYRITPISTFSMSSVTSSSVFVMNRVCGQFMLIQRNPNNDL